MRAAAISTRITRLLNIEYPVLLPGMSWISTPELVAAVSNAGGCGILATGPLSSQETRESIRLIREKTDKPFGIGATLLMPGAEANAKVALEEQVPLINVSLGKPDWIAEKAKSYGGKVLCTVVTTKHAKSAIECGADALMLTGHEAAAHGGDITSHMLIETCSNEFPDIPLVAAGGFATGASLASAITVGADAIACGSRFAVTKESSLPDNIKEIIVKSNSDDTIYGKNFDGLYARVLRTPLSKELMSKRPWLPTILFRAINASKDLDVPLWKIIAGLIYKYDQIYAVAQFGAATTYLKKSTIHGDIENGIQFIGQSQGMINDVPTVDALMQRIIQESKVATERTHRLLTNTTDDSRIGQNSDAA